MTMLYGFDIGGTKIEMAVFDLALNEIWRKRIDTPHDSYDAFLFAIINLIFEADQKFNSRGQIGIGIAGIVNQKDKTVFTTNIEMVKDKPFIRDLETRVGRDIRIDNDANCFVLSEAYNPEFNHYHSVIGLILGTGLGGGLAIDHAILSGANGCAGEIGHFKLPLNATKVLGNDIPLITCGCGQVGCSERYLSGTGFAWLYRHFYQQSLSAPEIIQRYYDQDKHAIAHVDRYLELLAMYLADILVVLDVELIVIGGGLSNFEQIYTELPKRLPRYLLKMMPPPRIEKARYGDAGGARGAALLWAK